MLEHMTNTLAYIQSSKPHLDYFRIRLPLNLQTQLRQTCIRRSLPTKCTRQAVITGSELLYQSDALVNCVNLKCLDLVTTQVGNEQVNSTSGAICQTQLDKPRAGRCQLTNQKCKLINPHTVSQNVCYGTIGGWLAHCLAGSLLQAYIGQRWRWPKRLAPLGQKNNSSFIDFPKANQRLIKESWWMATNCCSCVQIGYELLKELMLTHCCHCHWRQHKPPRLELTLYLCLESRQLRNVMVISY